MGATRGDVRRVRGALFTIGYEGRTVNELVQRLRSHDIRVLVDVRQNAVSRKAGFGKNQLQNILRSAGIEYIHVPSLGNPRENREAFHSGPVGQAKRRYLRHLNNGPRAAFDQVVSLALTRRVALLCFERDQSRCHRSCIVEQALSEQEELSVTEL
jgi:uncharacterized protein (DUF488 family)